MPTDIEIARSVTPLPITEVAKNAGVDVSTLFRTASTRLRSTIHCSTSRLITRPSSSS